MKFVSLVCVFVFLYSASAIHGTYRQCNFDTGDETILEIGPGPNFDTKMTFLFGGCLEGEIQYEVDAEFQLVFVSDRDDGGSNVELHYKSAVATAHTDDAVNALTSRFYCPSHRRISHLHFRHLRKQIRQGTTKKRFGLLVLPYPL